MHAGTNRQLTRVRKNFGFSKISLSLFRNSCSTPLRPDPTRGRFAVVTDVGCGMRWALGSQHGFAVPTNDPWCTVKSRGPGLPMLRSSRWAMRKTQPAGDGGKQARSPGRARISRQTSRREGRVFGQTCGTCRLHFFPQAGHGRGQRPAFPAPSVRKRAVRWRNSSGARRREIAKVCPQMPCGTVELNDATGVIVSAATCPPKLGERRRKQSRLSLRRQSGLLRRFAPRNDGGWGGRWATARSALG
jgi:hypothetical protein